MKKITFYDMLDINQFLSNPEIFSNITYKFLAFQIFFEISFKSHTGSLVNQWVKENI